MRKLSLLLAASIGAITQTRSNYAPGVTKLTGDLISGDSSPVLLVKQEFPDLGGPKIYAGYNILKLISGVFYFSVKASQKSLAQTGGDAPKSSATITVASGTVGSGNQVTQITIDGIQLLNAPVAYTTNQTTTAGLIATAINTATTRHGYTATSSGAVVTINAPAIDGAIHDGKNPTITAVNVTVNNTTRFVYSGELVPANFFDTDEAVEEYEAQRVGFKVL